MRREPAEIKAILQPPTIESQFQRLLDGMGLHDEETIPTATVFKMFDAFFRYEHKWNLHLQKALNDYNSVTPHPLVIPKHEAKDA